MIYSTVCMFTISVNYFSALLTVEINGVIHYAIPTSSISNIRVECLGIPAVAIEP